MNIWGGDFHNSASYRCRRSQNATTRSADPDICSPDALLVPSAPGEQRRFVHKRIFGGIKGAIGGLLGGPGGILGGAVGGFLRGGQTAVPQATRCPPGFVLTAAGCAPTQPLVRAPLLPGGGRFDLDPRAFQDRGGQFPQPTPAQRSIREREGLAIDPAAGVAVMGQFGAGFEPEVFDTMVRRCPRGAVLGMDGICYNRRDLRNSERFWPRGRRPLLTGGEMRAISTASAAAKKLQRKEKQLQQLGLLKKPASRSRRALPAGHRAELVHSSSHD